MEIRYSWDEAFRFFLSQLEFDLIDLQMLKILDNALENCSLGSRFGFLVGTVKESARSRLDVPHNML